MQAYRTDGQMDPQMGGHHPWRQYPYAQMGWGVKRLTLLRVNADRQRKKFANVWSTILKTQWLPSHRQLDYTPSPTNLTVVESASRRRVFSWRNRNARGWFHLPCVPLPSYKPLHWDHRTKFINCLAGVYKGRSSTLTCTVTLVQVFESIG
jgi:hypothetical protein